MIIYIGKRIAIACVTLLVILFVLFSILQFMPGSPFNDEKLTANQIQVLNKKYGLDKPIYIRFKNYVGQLLRGDFGDSYVIQKNMPISKLLATRFPITLQIGIQAMGIGIVCGLLLGIFAAIWHDTVLDPFTSVLSMLGASIPSYVFGLGLMYFLGYKLKLFPLLYADKARFMSGILPSIALAMLPIAQIARFSRNEMVEVLQAEYITFAQAKGGKQRTIIVRHALRNAMVPILTIIAPMLVGTMLGSTVIESIYSIPGIGSLFITAIQVNDYNVVIAIALIYSFLYISVMLVVDILYGLIDPRIRVAGEE